MTHAAQSMDSVEAPKRSIKDRFAAALGTLDRLVDFFIPPKIAEDRDASNRAHVFLISHILGPFIGNVVPISIYFFDPAPGIDVVVLAVSITAFWLFPFLLRTGIPYNLLALVSIQNLIFCILWSCYFYGGVTSPTLAWVLVIPLLAFFYLGSSRVLCLIVMGMFAANAVVYQALHMLGLQVKNDLPLAAMQGLGLVSTIAASLYVTMMALYYAKIQASHSELESEMREHMSTADALRQATAEAERAGAAKAEFLAKMSHELRTPLNAVIGYSQILLEDAEIEGDDASVADLAKIHTAGQHLLKLVNEILDLSKIEAGKMELDFEETDLVPLFGEIADKAQAAVVHRNNRFVVEIADDLGHALCDTNRLQNVVGQLLDNAAKFTLDGCITLRVNRLDDDDDRSDLMIEVIDTGIGIAAHQMAGLFEKFSVADDSSTTKYGGTGLGLALSQKLCKLMGGEIRVTSTLGQGSCFTIRIPLIAGRRKGDRHAAATLVPLDSAGCELPSDVEFLRA